MVTASATPCGLPMDATAGLAQFNSASLELIGEPYDAVNGNYTLELTATDSFEPAHPCSLR